MLADHVLDPEIRVPFLAGLSEENDIARQRHVEPLQKQHRHHAGRQVVLVVHGAAAVDVAAVSRRRKRRVLPLGRIHRHDVGVAHDQERTLLTVALQPRDDVRSVGIEGKDLRGNAFLIEQLLDVLHGHVLIAWRVARIEPHQRLEMPHRFFLDGSPVRRLHGGLRNEADRRGQHRQDHRGV